MRLGSVRRGLKRLDWVFWVSAILLTAGVLALGYWLKIYGLEYGFEELDVKTNALFLFPYHVVSVAGLGVVLLVGIAYFFHSVHVALRVFISLLFSMVLWALIICFGGEILDSMDTDIAPDPERVQKLRFGEAGEFLAQADRVVLYSLAPDQIRVEQRKKFPNNLHDFKILGSVEIKDAVVIKHLREELRSRIYSDSGSSVTMCFWPRHGIRAFHNGEVRDYLICFECHRLYYYRDSGLSL